jgi:MinD-like ATPase involved in chromosome partitioning or flagellar assembly
MTIDQESQPGDTDVPFAPRSAFAGASRAEKYIEANGAAAAGLASTEPPLAALSDIGLGGLAAPAPTATSGIRGLARKLGITLAPGKAETAKLEAAELQRLDEEVIRQTTWTRAVSILIANPKGGVGKTPTALALGGVLGAIRGGSVCILEVSDDPGALTFRAEGNPKLGLGELVRDIETIRTAGQLAGYTAPQSSFASVIGTVGRRQHLGRDDVIEVARVIDEFYSIRVMDSGNQPSSSAFAGAVATADVLVVPVYNTGDAVIEALNLLVELRAMGDHAAELADAAILLWLTDGRPENLAVVERVGAMVGDAGFAQQFSIPFDPHIAERSQISLTRLAQPTVRAFTAAAAGVINALQSTVR